MQSYSIKRQNTEESINSLGYKYLSPRNRCNVTKIIVSPKSKNNYQLYSSKYAKCCSARSTTSNSSKYNQLTSQTTIRNFLLTVGSEISYQSKVLLQQYNTCRVQMVMKKLKPLF